MNSSVSHRSRLQPATNRHGSGQDEAGVRPASRRTKGRLTSCVALAMLAAAGCQPDGSDPTVTGTPLPTATVSPSLSPVEAAKQAALMAYRGMWAAFSAASRAGNPEHPDLPRHAADDALDLLVSGLETNQREGLVSGGGEVVLYPEVVELEPAEAPVRITVSDCADTSATRRVRPTGPPFTDSPGGWRQVTAYVEPVDGEWKVTNLVIQEVGSCAPER